MRRRDHRTLDGKTWTLIEYNLTLKEEVQLVIATIRALLSGKRIADYLTSELENILCLYVPTRHKVIKLYDGDVKSDTGERWR